MMPEMEILGRALEYCANGFDCDKCPLKNVTPYSWIRSRENCRCKLMRDAAEFLYDYNYNIDDSGIALNGCDDDGE